MSSFIGPLFIAICMILRSTDVFFRKTTLSVATPLELITLEHMLVAILMTPFGKAFSSLSRLGVREWFCLLFVSWGSSVGGILCFTTAFQYTNPSVVILLQKLQPVVTVFLSVILLREKIDKSFYLWAIIAIVSGYFLSFGLTSPHENFDGLQINGIIYSLAAVFLWGSGTVFGKMLLFKLSDFTVTKLRYYLGFIFALLLYFCVRKEIMPDVWGNNEYILMILYMAFVPGFLALFFFYKGLKSCKASISSILELIFPLSSVAIVWIFLNQPLNKIQVISGTVLLLSIVRISIINKKYN